MRAKLAVWTTLAAAALAGAALAQTVYTYDGPPYSGNPPDSAGARHSQPVFAVVGGHVVSGVQHPAVAALTLVDAANPEFACQVGHRGALVHLACSDGSDAEVTIGPFGCGQSVSGQAASLCYGVEARSAVRKLRAPAGHRLSIEYGRLTLKPTAG
jgi:hypothetical protein